MICNRKDAGGHIYFIPSYPEIFHLMHGIRNYLSSGVKEICGKKSELAAESKYVGIISGMSLNFFSREIYFAKMRNKYMIC